MDDDFQKVLNELHRCQASARVALARYRHCAEFLAELVEDGYLPRRTASDARTLLELAGVEVKESA